MLCYVRNSSGSAVDEWHISTKLENNLLLHCRSMRPLPLPLRSLPRSATFGPRRTASADRYLAIHHFFTRHAASPISRHIPRRLSSSPAKRCLDCPTSQPPPNPDNPTPYPPQGHAQEYAPFIQRLIRQSKAIAPNSPHRPSKEELLEAANGWWQRMRIRLKWFTIRGWRRFNTDDMSAFASWFLVGNSRSHGTFESRR